MLVSFVVLPDSAEQEPQVIFNTPLITPVPRLLEMKTCSRVLNQRAVYVIATLFDRAEIL
jgi:hypothetical protein